MKTFKEISALSMRHYGATWIEGNEIVNEYFTLADMLVHQNVEWLYAVQERLDEILDLREGESMTMSFHRDNPKNIGIIKRLTYIDSVH